jgi:hypothetical protein
MTTWVQDDNNTGVFYVSTAVVDKWIDDAASRIFHMQVQLAPAVGFLQRIAHYPHPISSSLLLLSPTTAHRSSSACSISSTPSASLSTKPSLTPSICARKCFISALLPPHNMIMYDFMTLFAENVTEVDFAAERDDIVQFYATFTPPPANKLQVRQRAALCFRHAHVAVIDMRCSWLRLLRKLSSRTWPFFTSGTRTTTPSTTASTSSSRTFLSSKPAIIPPPASLTLLQVR